MKSMEEMMAAAQQAAETIQKQMNEMQVKLDSIEVEGTAGGGLVKVRASAKGRIEPGANGSDRAGQFVGCRHQTPDIFRIGMGANPHDFFSRPTAKERLDGLGLAGRNGKRHGPRLHWLRPCVHSSPTGHPRGARRPI